MIEVNLYVDQREKESEDIRKVLLIQEQFSGKFTRLALPHRRFVRDGPVFNPATKKQCHWFLFNDLLVVTRAMRNRKYHVQEMINLVDFSLYENQPATQVTLGGVRSEDNEETTTLFLKTSGVKYLPYVLSSTEEKASWVSSISVLQRSVCINLASIEGSHSNQPSRRSRTPERHKRTSITHARFASLRPGKTTL